MPRQPPSTAKLPLQCGRLKRQLGFTLIELMVVLFIMATMAGFALLALGDAGRGDKLKAEATRLHDAMQLASEEAEMRGNAIGASIESGEYRFSIRMDNQWQALDRDPILHSHDLPAGMQLTLDKPDRAATQMNDTRPPDLIFYTSGESTAFQIGLSDSEGTGHYRLSGNGYGVFSVEPQSGAP